MTARWNRRTFLRGVGGAAVAAPFLSSVWDRKAKGQAAPAKPRQLIVMFTHYGCITTKWFPVKSHGPLVASDLAYTLAPLQPYVGKLLIPRGIRAMNEWTQDNKGAGKGLGQGNDIHLNGIASFFTCQPVTPNTNDPYSFDTATKFNAVPVGTSLDHAMAQQISPMGTPLFMRVGNRNDPPQSGISYVKDPSAAANAGAKGYPGVGQVSQVFSELTGLFAAGATTPASYAAIRGKKISDLVRAELADFKRQDMSSEDRRKVEAWESLVNDAGTTVTSMCTQDLATRLGATSANVMPVSNISNMVTSDLDGADMYSVMAVLAAACNYNPVIFLKYPPNYVYSGLGITADSDNLAHRLDNAGLNGTCYPDVLNLLRKLDTYYATKFAKLVGMLDSVQNGDGSTLLDSSAAVWLQDSSDGCAHNMNNLPIIQAGSCGGTFKTGWTINVENGAANLTQGNSEAQCAPGGTGLVDGLNKGTGTDPELANAPINKYFYNLMNAMGVKGDANGFPMVGGSAEVTRFGYSDLTTDFCGGFGAVAGAGVHDPGEYTALKST
jgi:Protein of unknown function (DUF1552)